MQNDHEARLEALIKRLREICQENDDDLVLILGSWTPGGLKGNDTNQASRG